MKILFICSKNKWRSPTAEKIFHDFNGYDVRSAGTEVGAKVKVTNGHIGWADFIFVMEKKHIRRLKDKFGPMLNNKKVLNLDIPDDYCYMDDELIEILKARVGEFLEVPE
ncbi:protein tyrosine phosphatase [Anaerobacillus alkaliphilus]|uniref:Protein tyrosine phosphatase n=1 Tax=Anaerobacillus alkaliphilus TaxID=1548597 RepID=A0A4Q0VXE0_9BACI|nr:protein tyrosine phosphatase [Anaerobacillus alkaliphilus]RXJ04417.1 protein tyrosine phosphatase [Anaerobacillus alkaliphilus]